MSPPAGHTPQPPPPLHETCASSRESHPQVLPQRSVLHNASGAEKINDACACTGRSSLVSDGCKAGVWEGEAVARPVTSPPHASRGCAQPHLLDRRPWRAFRLVTRGRGLSARAAFESCCRMAEARATREACSLSTGLPHTGQDRELASGSEPVPE